MATIAEVVEGLEILAKTARIPKALIQKGETDGRQASISVDHGIIYGPDANPNNEDKYQLEKLGWFFDIYIERWTLHI